MINHKREAPYTVTFFNADNIQKKNVIYAENVLHAISIAQGFAQLKKITSVTIWG